MLHFRNISETQEKEVTTKEAPKVVPLPSKVGRRVKVVESGERISINEERYEVTIDGSEIYVAPKEFKILAILKQSGKTMSRRDILNAVWGATKSNRLDERTIDQHIARLRRKITAAGIRGADVIRTQNSFGYVYKPI